MKPLEILFTNNTLGNYAGTELYVRDVALALKQRGYQPMAFSQKLGKVAETLEAAGIKVVNDLNKIETTPDIIHGHHSIETMMAVLHFPNTPAINYCHGYVPWQEHPPVFPRILRYIAVDQACLERLQENEITNERIRVLHNFVDLKRFLPRAPLPSRPAKALVFSNHAREDNFLPTVRAACDAVGIKLDVAGLGAGAACYEPEKLLPQYDLVFAKGRGAMEALAVGCAAIVCDVTGLGAMVTTENLSSFRRLNFGFRTLTKKLEAELIGNEIAHYDAGECAAVSGQMRAMADMEHTIDQLVCIYDEVIKEFRKLIPCREVEEKAVAAYLGWLAETVKKTETRLTEMCHAQQRDNLILTEKLNTAHADAVKVHQRLHDTQIAADQLEMRLNRSPWRRVTRSLKKRISGKS